MEADAKKQDQEYHRFTLRLTKQDFKRLRIMAAYQETSVQGVLEDRIIRMIQAFESQLQDDASQSTQQSAFDARPERVRPITGEAW